MTAEAGVSAESMHGTAMHCSKEKKSSNFPLLNISGSASGSSTTWLKTTGVQSVPREGE